MPLAVPGKPQYIATGTGLVQAAIDRYWGGGQAQILWVGNRSGLPAGDGSSPDYPLSSLIGTGGALAKLNGATGRGSIIFVEPGHAESVNAADWASVQGNASAFAIVGLGVGTQRPTFTWTTNTSTWLMDQPGQVFDNLNFNFEPGTGTGGSPINVAAPITISAAGCQLRNLLIRAGTDANNIVTIGITCATGSTDVVIDNVDIFGATAAECTTMIQFTQSDRMKLINSKVRCATSAVGVGVIRFLTTATVNIEIDNCTFANSKAASTCVITGMAGIGGQIASRGKVHCCVLGNAAAQIVINGANSAITTAANLQCGEGLSCTNDIAETAAKMTAVSA